MVPVNYSYVSIISFVKTLCQNINDTSDASALFGSKDMLVNVHSECAALPVFITSILIVSLSTAEREASVFQYRVMSWSRGLTWAPTKWKLKSISSFPNKRQNFTGQDGEQLPLHSNHLWHLFHRIMPHRSVGKKQTLWNKTLV